LKPGYNIVANESYSNKVLQIIGQEVLKREMIYDFPDLIGSRHFKANKTSTKTNQLTLMKYM